MMAIDQRFSWPRRSISFVACFGLSVLWIFGEIFTYYEVIIRFN